MDTSPLISVLIPTFNYGRYLEEAIASVLLQEDVDLELIIADDASTDDTAALCERLADRDQRIRFHRHPQNIGMVQNWNWCLRQARGRYIKYLLADDKLVGAHALHIMSEILEHRPDIALVTCSRLIMDECSRVVDHWKPLGNVDRTITAASWIALHLEEEPRDLNSIGEPTAVMFRRADAARGFDESLRQLVDLDMWLHLLKDRAISYVAEPLCCFRKHALQQTEVNRGGHLHKREEVELCYRYCPLPSRRRVLFRKMQKMKKYDIPEYQPLIATIHRDYGRASYMGHWISYRWWRLKANLRHSWDKRRKGLRSV